ncbi:MAG TPA: hypothetical protein VKS19_05230, partial [Verrucomicrobiae bacterium]|nr:hypothetical protein [Verrucomicrobiae bacterium]
VFNHARPGNQKQLARRIEAFPDGSIVEHPGVLAVKRGKVNGTRQPDTTERIIRGSPYSYQAAACVFRFAF